MSSSDIDARVGDSDEVTYCYGHPNTPTKLRCSRCDRPICGRCAIPASVGQHCPECVAEARRGTPKVRTAMQATAPALMAIIAINVIAFVLQIVTNDEITVKYLLLPVAVSQGEYWRLLTAMFLHAGALHILMNMYALFIIGPNVEQAYGTRAFVPMYLLAGLMGSAFSYAFPPQSPSLGASGAVFGVVGMLVVYLYRRRRSAFIAQYLRSITLLIGINAVLGFVIPGIDWVAHLGGLVGGVLLGVGFDVGRGPQAESPAALRIASMAAVAGLIAFLVAAGPF
jgi:membrane associated rhomboid family serine protease